MGASNSVVAGVMFAASADLVFEGSKINPVWPTLNTPTAGYTSVAGTILIARDLLKSSLVRVVVGLLAGFVFIRLSQRLLHKYENLNLVHLHIFMLSTL